MLSKYKIFDNLRRSLFEISIIFALIYINIIGKIFNIDFRPDLLVNSFKNIDCDYKYFVADPKDRERIKNDEYSKGNKFEYAYCSTTHLSQGSEYSGGIYIEEQLGGNIQNSLNYTGITRFKNFLIYVKKNKKKYYFISG